MVGVSRVVCSVLLCGITLHGLPRGGQQAALAGSLAGTTFRCPTYGYSLQVPAGWGIKTHNCTKTVTNLLEATNRAAIIGVQIVGVNTLTEGFNQVVTRELGVLGVPKSAINFGWQQSGSVRYDMAAYAPIAQGPGPSLASYIVGTEQNGVTYAFQGYITAREHSAAVRLATQMRDVYYSILYFKPTAGAPGKMLVIPPLHPTTSDSSSLLGYLLLLAVATLAAAGMYLGLVRRPVPQTGS